MNNDELQFVSLVERMLELDKSCPRTPQRHESPAVDGPQTVRRLSHNLMKKNMITIGFLADHLDSIPTLAGWFRDQWPDYYINWSQAEMEQDFLEDASRDRLPSRLVAFESNELVGTIILRENGNETLPEYQP